MKDLRPKWTVRSPQGAVLTVEFDTLRNRWRVEPGGYERREVADALAQATGDRPDVEWIVQAQARLLAAQQV